MHRVLPEHWRRFFRGNREAQCAEDGDVCAGSGGGVFFCVPVTERMGAWAIRGAFRGRTAGWQT